MKSYHVVSCKVILLNEEHTKALICYYGSDDGYGLIGGHLEDGENPDTAIEREISEEIGVKVDDIQHFDFMQHPHGKILLLFEGTLPEDSNFTLDKSEIQSVLWIDASDVASKKYDIGCYQPVLEQVFNSAL